MTACVLCGHKVSRGNQHAKGTCPPRPGRRGEHDTFGRKRHLKNAAYSDAPQRGVPVPGIHKTKKGSTK